MADPEDNTPDSGDDSDLFGIKKTGGKFDLPSLPDVSKSSDSDSGDSDLFGIKKKGGLFDLSSSSSSDSGSSSSDSSSSSDTKPSKPQSFGAAFKAARARGDKTFSWKGGSYGTKLASPGAPARKSRSGTGKSAGTTSPPASTKASAPAPKPSAPAPKPSAPAKTSPSSGRFSVAQGDAMIRQRGGTPGGTSKAASAPATPTKKSAPPDNTASPLRKTPEERAGQARPASIFSGAKPKNAPATPAPSQRKLTAGKTQTEAGRNAFAAAIARGKANKKAKGGAVKKMAKGGGIEKRGKTKTQRFARGGKIDGIAKRGHTKARRST